MNYKQSLKLAEALGLRVEQSLAADDSAHGKCEHWNNLIHLKVGMSDSEATHVLLHEIAHATGVKTKLNRETLAMYGECALHALVEENIVEATAVVLLQSFGVDVDLAPLSYLTKLADKEGIEFGFDIEPEVQNIVDYLTPYIKEIV